MTDDTKNLYEERSNRYEITTSRDSIDDLVPEWVSILKRYFEKHPQK